MGRYFHQLLFVCVTCVLLTLTGCFSSTAGSPELTDDKVREIKKGVTTRQDIERMFGPPEMATLMGGGKRSLHYQFTESNIHANALTYVPLVGGFIGGKEGEFHMRTLQVILAANGTVEDYEFNDTTTDTSQGPFISGSSQSETVAHKNLSGSP